MIPHEMKGFPMTTPGPADCDHDPDNPDAEPDCDGQDSPPIATADPFFPESAWWTPPRIIRDPSAVIIKAVGAVALVVIGGFSAYELISESSAGHQISGNPGGQQISSASDEDQIKKLVAAWTDDLNKHDLAGLTSLMCGGSASQLPHNVFNTRDKIGPLSSAASNIVVTGDRATASIISTWSNGTHNAETDTYAKENGSWKICHTVNF